MKDNKDKTETMELPSPTIFIGTSDEWNALSSQEQLQYQQAEIDGIWYEWETKNNCKFCSKIYTNEEAEKWKDSIDWEQEDYNKPIVMRYDSGEIYLWARCDDSYYTGAVMEIGYCPVCGRKLMEVE